MVSLPENWRDKVMRMSEGNPGALNVLMAVLHVVGPEKGLPLLDQLDQAGVRGPSLWAAYDDVCGRDLTRFLDAIVNDIESLKSKERQ